MHSDIEIEIPIEDENDEFKEVPQKPRHTWVVRYAFGIISGFIANVLIASSIGSGAYRALGRSLEADETTFPLLFYGEHWAWNVVFSFSACYGASVIAGIISRNHGSIIAIISRIPTLLLWLCGTYFAWSEATYFFEEETLLEGVNWLYFSVGLPPDGSPLSIGNALCATLITLALVPISYKGGQIGEKIGKEFGPHFDTRRYSILGINIWHYLWIPFYLFIAVGGVTQMTIAWFRYAVLDFRTMGIVGLVAMFFMIAYGYTVYFALKGVVKCYCVLSSFSDSDEQISTLKGIFKYGFGYPLLAMMVQIILTGIHVFFQLLFT